MKVECFGTMLAASCILKTSRPFDYIPGSSPALICSHVVTFAGYATALGNWTTSCELSFYSQTYLAIALKFTATVTVCVGFCPCALYGHWKYCRLWFFPLNGFYWTPLSWGRLSFEMCPVKMAEAWSSSPGEAQAAPGTWWAAATGLCPADGTLWSLLGCVEMLLTRSMLQHPGSGLLWIMYPYRPSVRQLVVLAAASAEPHFLHWNKVVGERKHPKGYQLDSIFFYFHTPKLSYNVSVKFNAQKVFQSPQNFIGTH